MYTPPSEILKKCARMYGVIAQVLYVDEYHTSKLCPSCQSEVTHPNFTSVKDASKKQSQREEKRRNWAAKRRQKHLERVARRSQSAEESTTPTIHPGLLSFFFFPPLSRIHSSTHPSVCTTCMYYCRNAAG